MLPSCTTDRAIPTCWTKIRHCDTHRGGVAWVGLWCQRQNASHSYLNSHEREEENPGGAYCTNVSIAPCDSYFQKGIRFYHL